VLEQHVDANMDRVGGAPDRVSGERAARAAAHEAQEFFRCSLRMPRSGWRSSIWTAAMCVSTTLLCDARL